jgi:hypothetical protein
MNKKEMSEEMANVLIKLLRHDEVNRELGTDGHCHYVMHHWAVSSKYEFNFLILEALQMYFFCRNTVKKEQVFLHDLLTHIVGTLYNRWQS